MQVQTPILASLAVILSLTVIPFYVNNATAGVPCLNTACLNTPWPPYGPHATLHNVLLKYYSSDAAEFADFFNGGLDLADSGAATTGPPSSQWPAYDANQDFNLSPNQPGVIWHGIYFNGANDRFGPDPSLSWGCDWQGYNSACGQEMRQAFAHLIDRPAFTTNNLPNYGATPTWDDIPASEALAGGTAYRSPPSTFCTWDTLNNTGCSLNTGPYNLAPDPTGFATTGSPDFCIAADHIINALKTAQGNLGLNPLITKNPTTCVLTGYSATITNNPLQACIRSTLPRRNLGFGFLNAMNSLFGNAVNRVFFGQFGCGIFGVTVFSEPPISPVNDWSWYTYGYEAFGPFPTYLYEQFSSQFAFDRADDVGFSPPDNQNGFQSVPATCPATSTTPNPFPPNPTFICNPQLDAALSSAFSSSTESQFDSFTLSALDILGRNAMTLPMYTFNVRTPALRTVDGLVNSRGLGYDTPREFNYAHKGPYIPIDSRYLFNGFGDPNTIRWGQAQPTNFLNPFQAGTTWELNTISLVYDTVFAIDPTLPGSVYCEMCRTFNVLTNSPNTIIDLTLRDGMTFQNGTPITAADVAFSYLNLRDFSSVFSGALLHLLGITLDPNNPLHLTITMQGASVDHLPNLATIPILPMSLWQCSSPCGSYSVGAGLTVPVVDNFKSSFDYDPVNAAAFIGSGLWECRSQFQPDMGQLGTGCLKNGDGSRSGQSPDCSGTNLYCATATLTVFDNTPGTTGFEQYTRLNNPSWGTGTNPRSGQLQEFIYADEFGNDTVTINDLNHIASCIGASSATAACPDYPYWAQPTALLGPGGTITINDYLIVFSHRFEGEVLPYSWTGSARQPGIGILPNIIAWPGH